MDDPHLLREVASPLCEKKVLSGLWEHRGFLNRPLGVAESLLLVLWFCLPVCPGSLLGW